MDCLALKLVQITPVIGHTYGNVHLITHVFRTVCCQNHAIGDEADRAADAQHVGPKPSSRFPVNLQAPLYAGQTTVIFNINEATHNPHTVSDLPDVIINGIRVSAANLKLYRLTFRWPAFLLAELQFYTG